MALSYFLGRLNSEFPSSRSTLVVFWRGSVGSRSCERLSVSTVLQLACLKNQTKLKILLQHKTSSCGTVEMAETQYIDGSPWQNSWKTCTFDLRSCPCSQRRCSKQRRSLLHSDVERGANLLAQPMQITSPGKNHGRTVI